MIHAAYPMDESAKMLSGRKLTFKNIPLTAVGTATGEGSLRVWMKGMKGRAEIVAHRVFGPRVEQLTIPLNEEAFHRITEIGKGLFLEL